MKLARASLYSLLSFLIGCPLGLFVAYLTVPTMTENHISNGIVGGIFGMFITFVICMLEKK